MPNKCRVGIYWILGLENRGCRLMEVDGAKIKFVIFKGSVMDNDANKRLVRDFLKNQYGYEMMVKTVEN